MNKTANFQLTQWEKTDRIMMEDFNRDNAAIDAALKSSADGVAALQTALASCGNCKIVAKTYVGTGQNGQGHPNTLTFDSQPLLVIIGTYETRNLYLLSAPTPRTFSPVICQWIYPASVVINAISFTCSSLSRIH